MTSRLVSALFLLVVTTQLVPCASCQVFDIQFDAATHAAPITGRAYLIVSRSATPEPRLTIGWEDQPPVFGVDLDRVAPGQRVRIGTGTLGYPLKSLADIPSGDYYVQALISIYSEFHRSDGHVIWAHMDQWEGQKFWMSPGNLTSDVQRIHIDPANHTVVTVNTEHVIKAIEEPQDNSWLKHIKIQSMMLTKFWGKPIYLGATVLLPKGYDAHENVRYPVVYIQGHFGQVPFFFDADPNSRAKDRRLVRFGLETGFDFYQFWNGDNLPRFIAITFDHPTPFFDDSYAVNSANCGPYGDAIMQELIPYLESHFRIIAKPYARLLEGASTGGWEALALQLYHPDFFGGAWVFYPDPIDFRNYGLVNLYQDENAFSTPQSANVSGVFSKNDWRGIERHYNRRRDGQPLYSVQDVSRLETVIGGRARSGGQLEAWESVFAPVGADGYPQEIWDKQTGKIDKTIVEYMRSHNYDLREFAERNWPSIGPLLKGKLNFFVGDMDDYYLNLAVYRFEDFLKSTQQPHDEGHFEYGRPIKGHGWHPFAFSQLLKIMGAQVKQNTPADSDSSAWNY